MPYKSVDARRACQRRRYRVYRKVNEARKFKDKVRSITRQIIKEAKKCSIENCTTTGERHHPDYSQPEKIVWLCRKHHAQLHRKEPKICSKEDCNGVVRGRGFCIKHYMRWWRHEPEENNMTYIKIDLADKTFSYYIRLRDGKCQRCGSLVRVNLKTNLPTSHHASHYFGRGKESTRFDPDNVCCLCFSCHRLWSSDEREDYRAYMIKKLGQRGFDALTIRANQTVKKDRKMALIQAKLLLEEVI